MPRFYDLVFIRGASPLGLPYTLSRGNLRARGLTLTAAMVAGSFAWLAFAALGSLTLGAPSLRSARSPPGPLRLPPLAASPPSLRPAPRLRRPRLPPLPGPAPVSP